MPREATWYGRSAQARGSGEGGPGGSDCMIFEGPFQPRPFCNSTIVPVSYDWCKSEGRGQRRSPVFPSGDDPGAEGKRGTACHAAGSDPQQREGRAAVGHRAGFGECAHNYVLFSP